MGGAGPHRQQRLRVRARRGAARAGPAPPPPRRAHPAGALGVPLHAVSIALVYFVIEKIRVIS